jgi:hypothetical protein
MNLRKAALGTGAGLLVLLLAAAIAVKVMIDPERLKQAARDKVRKAWARELTLADVRLEFTPLPTVTARDIAVGEPDEPAMRAAALIADLELVPLLLGEARYRTIYIRDATIERDGSVWRIDEGRVESGPNLHNVKLSASLWRNRRPVGLVAEFDDLSALGQDGASTRGRIELEWNEAKLVAAGRMPLDGTLEGHELKVELGGQSLKGLLDFFGIERRPTAPFALSFASREAEGIIELSDLVVALGRVRLQGKGRYRPAPQPEVDLTLRGDRLDWARTYLDAGGEPAPPPVPPEMFHDTPLAWWVATGLRGYRGKMDLRLGTFILRNGVELTDFRTQVHFDDDQLALEPFETRMLGGQARGVVRLDGGRKRVRFDFEGSNLLLERWLRERGSKTAFKGGPMKVTAKLESGGNSMRQLVGAMNGPLRIRMGPGVLDNPRAGTAESKLTGSGGEGESQAVKFECVGFNLPFKSGRASGERLIGARTDSSHIVTSGLVDMGTQQIDLRGRMKGRRGVNLASIAGDVKFTGTTRQPRMSLDEDARGKVVARGAIAVATLGLSAIGTSAADAEEGRRTDPCEVVFR